MPFFVATVCATRVVTAQILCNKTTQRFVRVNARARSLVHEKNQARIRASGKNVVNKFVCLERLQQYLTLRCFVM